MNAVILAGGRGKRLWPMSRQKKPKHLFNILSDQAMIVDAYNRLQKVFNSEKIFVATLPDLKPLIQELLPELSDDQYLIEPAKRDCGPARALASLMLKKRGLGDESVVFCATDHYIGDDEKFGNLLQVGADLVQKTGKMVVTGVTPQFANEGLGYTQIGEQIDCINGVRIFQYLGHTEKPTKEKAQKYIESGKYLWHANYYMWTPNKFLQSYQTHAPEIYELLLKMNQAETEEAKKTIFEKMPQISFDYAIAEKLDPNEVLTVWGDFGWSDIGVWSVLYDRLAIKENQSSNVIKGKVVDVDTHNCLIYSSSKKLIATFGLQDMVIVDTDDALLICPQSRSQEVKKLVEAIKERGFEDFL